VFCSPMLKTETYFSMLPVLMFLVVLAFAAIEHEQEQEQEQD
jgi:preprotein translocase subunit YajC